MRQCILLTPAVPNAAGSGLEQRAFHLLRELAMTHSVILVLAGPEALSSQLPLEAMELAAETVDLLTLPKRRWHEWPAICLPPLAWVSPGLAVGWLKPAAPLPSLPGQVSMVVIFRLRTLGVARQLQRSIAAEQGALLDIDDDESATLWSIGCRALRRGRLRLAFRSLAQSMQLLGLEGTLLRRYQVGFANEADRAALARRAGHSMLVHRANLVRKPRTLVRAPASVLTLLFVGTLSYFPNEDAVLWLAEEIVPRLRTALGERFTVHVVGRQASPRLLRAIHRVPEILFLGEVEAVAPCYARAHAVLATVRCGGGTKVKVLEAVAHRCLVIGTPHALRGLPASVTGELLCGEDTKSIVQHVVNLQRHWPEAQRMADQAYARLAASGLLST